MIDRNFYKQNLPKIKASNELKQSLYDLEERKSSNRQFHLSKVAVVVILAAVTLVGGTVGLAIGHGFIFNEAGKRYDAEYYMNGQKQDVQLSVDEKGDFHMKTKDGLEVQANGGKNYLEKHIKVEYRRDGKSHSIVSELSIDSQATEEIQTWQVRESLVNDLIYKDSEETSEEFIEGLQKTAENLQGVWKTGVLQAIGDLKKIGSGRKISISSYDFRDNRGLSYLYIDYTKHMPAKNKETKFQVESVAGYKTMFDVVVKNVGGTVWVSEYGPAK